MGGAEEIARTRAFLNNKAIILFIIIESPGVEVGYNALRARCYIFFTAPILAIYCTALLYCLAATNCNIIFHFRELLAKVRD